MRAVVPAGRLVGLLAVTLVAIALAPASAAAQDEATLVARYEAAVEALRQQRDMAPGLVLARDWTRGQFDTALARSRQDSPAFWRAAALLHLELAAGVIDATADEALSHIRLGERALSPLLTNEGAPGGFVARWSVVAASLFLARTNPLQAKTVLDFGVDRRPQDAHVRLAAGVIEDLASLMQNAEGPRPALANRQVMAATQNRALLLTRAEREYRAALALDPDLAPARIRLGRVLFRRGRLEEARAELEPVLQAALATGDRYLLLLFLAPVYEGLGDVRAARTSLEEAVRMAGDRQGSWMALAQLEERDGRPDLARQIVAQGLARRSADVTDEWWAYRNGQFDDEGMTWLRAAVSR